jgi:hypothetical protein
MSKLAIPVVLATVCPALAQSFDPHIGSGNLSAVESGVTYLPPVPSGVCEVRRVQSPMHLAGACVTSSCAARRVGVRPD